MMPTTSLQNQLIQLQQTVLLLTEQINRFNVDMNASHIVYINTCCVHGTDCPNSHHTIPNNTINSNNNDRASVQTDKAITTLNQHIPSQLQAQLNTLGTNHSTPSEYIDHIKSMMKEFNTDQNEYKYEQNHTSNINQQNTNEYITVYTNNHAELTDVGHNAINVIFNRLDRNHNQYLTINELLTAMSDVLQRTYKDDDGMLYITIAILYYLNTWYNNKQTNLITILLVLYDYQ